LHNRTFLKNYEFFSNNSFAAFHKSVLISLIVGTGVKTREPGVSSVRREYRGLGVDGIFPVVPPPGSGHQPYIAGHGAAVFPAGILFLNFAMVFIKRKKTCSFIFTL